MLIWTLTHVGLIEEAADLVKYWGTNQNDDRLGYFAVSSEVSAARADSESAIPMVRELQAKLAPSPAVFWHALETEADLLVKQHDLAAAAALLRRTDQTRENAYPSWECSAYWWLRARVRLLQVERQLGNMDRANALQQELRQLLAVADPDFVVLRELN